MKVKISNRQTPSEKRYPLKIDYAAALPDSNLWFRNSKMFSRWLILSYRQKNLYCLEHGKSSRVSRINDDVNLMPYSFLTDSKFAAHTRALERFHLSMVTSGLESWICARKWWAVTEIFAMQRDWSCWPGVEALVRNRLLSLARRAISALARLSRASLWPRRSNPRPKSVLLCWDIRESMGRSCCIEQDAFLRNRPLNDCGIHRDCRKIEFLIKSQLNFY